MNQIALNKNNQKKVSLLWVDLEMTGLDPNKDKILELAAIVTDWSFRTLATFETDVKVEQELAEERMVGEFWEENSEARDQLLAQNMVAKDGSAAVEKNLLEFIDQNFQTDAPVYLAGNSIYNDRKFIANEMPILNNRLHYRMLDVSSFKLIAEELFDKTYQKNNGHRALDDIKESIAELEYYLMQAGLS